MGTERVGKLMRQYAIPCIISLLVGALYNIVDQIFIANASYLGSYGNAANTVVFPLTVVALAIAVMVGDGSCAFVSMALGRNEVDKAKCSVGNAVVLTRAAALPHGDTSHSPQTLSSPCSWAARCTRRPSTTRRSISSISRWASRSICLVRL